jgi:hypothetical protein
VCAARRSPDCGARRVATPLRAEEDRAGTRRGNPGLSTAVVPVREEAPSHDLGRRRLPTDGRLSLLAFVVRAHHRVDLGPRAQSEGNAERGCASLKFCRLGRRPARRYAIGIRHETWKQSKFIGEITLARAPVGAADAERARRRWTRPSTYEHRRAPTRRRPSPPSPYRGELLTPRSAVSCPGSSQGRGAARPRDGSRAASSRTRTRGRRRGRRRARAERRSGSACNAAPSR